MDALQQIKEVIKPIVPAHMVESYRARRSRAAFRRHLRPTDVFLVGHPKSGNTWLAYMLAIVLRKGFEPREPTLANVKEFIPAFHARDKAIRFYGKHPDPRIFRNEGPVYPEVYPKTIYIVRDPRSVLLSYYHHTIHERPDDGWTMEKYFDEILTYGCVRSTEPHLVRWDRQVAFWLERAKRQPVKIVRYEEMKEDRRRVLNEVLEFIGISCDSADIDVAVERSSFENMRKSEETHGAEPYSGTKGERGFYTRRGTLDSWRSELPPEIVKRIETELGAVMRRMGYL